MSFSRRLEVIFFTAILKVRLIEVRIMIKVMIIIIVIGIAMKISLYGVILLTKMASYRSWFQAQLLKKERRIKLQQHQQRNQHNNFVVYVADSTTYLLALIQADAGILLKVSRLTIELATKFGVTIRSLNEYNKYHNDDDTTENGDVGRIWTASDWDEIGSFFNHSDERLL